MTINSSCEDLFSKLERSGTPGDLSLVSWVLSIAARAGRTPDVLVRGWDDDKYLNLKKYYAEHMRLAGNHYIGSLSELEAFQIIQRSYQSTNYQNNAPFRLILSQALFHVFGQSEKSQDYNPVIFDLSNVVFVLLETTEEMRNCGGKCLAYSKTKVVNVFKTEAEAWKEQKKQETYDDDQDGCIVSYQIERAEISK